MEKLDADGVRETLQRIEKELNTVLGQRLDRGELPRWKAQELMQRWRAAKKKLLAAAACILEQRYFAWRAESFLE